MVYNITIFRYIAILEQFKKKENIKRGRTGNFHTKKLTREKKRSCCKEECFFQVSRRVKRKRIERANILFYFSRRLLTRNEAPLCTGYFIKEKEIFF